MNFTGLDPVEIEELRIRLEHREIHSASSAEDRIKLQRRMRLENNFSEFVKEAWHVIRPGIRLDWSWHYDLIGEYMKLVYQRKLRRLIINISPRTLKSILVSVMFPVWVWTKQPEHGFVCASYVDDLSSEHSVLRRDIIQSPWFQSLWGNKIWLAADDNTKTKYKNNYQAQMFATSVNSVVTGMGGNTLIVDDGMDPKRVASEAETKKTHKWFDEKWRSRMNNPAEDAMIIVEQRLGENDLTGHCLDGDKILAAQGEEPEWTTLVIPLECDEESGPQTFVFPVSGRVQQREVGDVLQCTRFTPAVVASLKVRRLVWSSQYQQRPSPLEGNLIKRSEILYYGGTDPTTGEADPVLPARFDLILVSADCAFKDEKTSDYVAIGTIGVKGPYRYLLDVTNKHLDLPATVREILRQKAKWGATTILVEDKANGPAVIKDLRRKISGVRAIEPEGGKFSRFFVAAGAWQSGNWLVDRMAAWVEAFVEQITKFPGGKHDDMADMMSQAETFIDRNTFVYGLTEHVKAKEEEMARKAKDRFEQSKPKTNADAIQERIPTTRAELMEKINNEQSPVVTKPEIDDKTERCDSCGATFIQRTPKGKRCGQCGNEWGQPTLRQPTTASFGEFRK